MRSRLAFLLIAALLGGCDQSQPTQPRQPIVVRSQAQDQLHSLSDLNRAIGLKRAILDSGQTCKRVTETGYVQEHDNLSMWVARCADGNQGGKEYAVFVGPDGSAQVRPCQDLAQLKLPACVIKGKPASGKP